MVFQGLYFSKALFEGLIYGGKFALIVRSKFTIFALFYFVFEGNFQVQALRGAYIRRDDLTEGFLSYEFVGFIFGGTYTWRGLFSEFYGMLFLNLWFRKPHNSSSKKLLPFQKSNTEIYSLTFQTFTLRLNECNQVSFSPGPGCSNIGKRYPPGKNIFSG